MIRDFEDDVDDLEITWTMSGAFERTLRFDCVRPGAEEEGDYILYTLSGDEITLTIYDFSDDWTQALTWNPTAGTGSFTADGVTGCWDENYLDVECPTE